MVIDASSEILTLLEAHAEAALQTSAANARYSERVLNSIGLVRQLLNGELAEVQGVVETWFNGFKPVAQIVFGTVINNATAMELPDMFGQYSPTLIPAVTARVRRTSLDEIMGPLLALDLKAQ